jgi:hypothetical protein
LLVAANRAIHVSVTVNREKESHKIGHGWGFGIHAGCKGKTTRRPVSGSSAGAVPERPSGNQVILGMGNAIPFGSRRNSCLALHT